MKAVTKSELAQMAGVSMGTLSAWIKSIEGEAYKAYEAEWKTGSTGCVTLYGYIVQQEFAELA